MFRQSKYRRRDGHEASCRCDHPQVAHYSASGGCVFPGCGCQGYRSKGREEYATAKRATCNYGHAHDSTLEVKECFDLHLSKQAHAIRSFEFHPVVDLPGPSGRIVARYEVDFRVDHVDGSIEWVECKGRHLASDPGWRLKWSLLQDKYYGDHRHKFRLRLI